MGHEQSKPETEMNASELARALAAHRRVVEGRCEICDQPFSGTRKRRYCSHNCAQKSYLLNKKRKTPEHELRELK
jgi:hypothetical protein